MTNNDFNSMQDDAIRQAMEMNDKSKHRSNQYQTPFCRNACPIKNILSPVTGELDGDILLLLALLLVLSNDGGDRILLFALVYIMT